MPFLFLPLLLFSPAPQTQLPAEEKEALALHPGEEVVGRLEAGGERKYLFSGPADGHLEALLMQLQGDVAIDLLDAEGSVQATFDYGTEDLEWIRARLEGAEGEMSLRVRAVGEHGAEYRLYFAYCEADGLTVADRARQFLMSQPASAPGEAFAVLQDGESPLILARGMAELEHEIPMDIHTPFRTELLRWVFLTEAILALEEQGQLALEQDVQELLAWFPRVEPPITIEDLLRRRRGIPNVLANRRWVEGDPDLVLSREALIADLSMPQSLQDWQSGDGGAIAQEFLLQEIIRVRTGQDLAEAMRTLVTIPLGMEDSRVLRTTDPPLPADGYYWFREGEWVRRSQPPVPLPRLAVSMVDLAHYFQGLWQKKDGKRPRWEKMLDLHALKSADSNGTTYYRFLPDEGAMVLEHGTAHNRLWNLTGVSLDDALFKSWQVRHPGRSPGLGRRGRMPTRHLAAKALEPLAGEYAAMGYGVTISLHLVDGNIQLHREGKAPELLFPAQQRRTLVAQFSTVLGLEFDPPTEGRFDTFELHLRDRGVIRFRRTEP